MHGSERHDRSFWGWDGTDAWFLISPTDTHIWNNDIEDTCMYAYYEKYYWKTECNLYYNVKQKKTFDEVIADKLKTQSHRTERLAYYNLLVGNEDGNTMYGNHQTIKNLLPEPSIRDYSLKREFGYEMTGWNQESDGLYQGMLDIIHNTDDIGKVTYYWINTGLEYQATKEHLDELEKKYGIRSST